ncbi:unnamed protein product [Orchesella dallaii]|uniref:PiggyBac transposable element-derived protein domain-containing protein n=1 Tax=Orchesella dallaii TaxID=48710 RepID=A0ABP1RQ62_9HEXA
MHTTFAINDIIHSLDLMATTKYIPLEAVQCRVIDPLLLTRFVNQCGCFKNNFKVLGYSADLRGNALTECKSLTMALITWKNENFIRFIQNPNPTNTLDRNGIIPDYRKRLVQFIKGITPVFMDVEDYYRSGFAAAVHEFRRKNRLLPKLQTT